MLYVVLFSEWITQLLGTDGIRTIHPVLCQLHLFLTYWLSDLSPWILVALTGERVLAVYVPLKVQLWTTRKKTYIYLSLLTAILAAINFHWILARAVLEVDEYGTYCEIHDPSWMHYADHIFPYIDFAVFAGLPFCILIVENMLIVSRIIYHRSQHLNASQVNSFRISQMTIVLFGISMAFIFFNGPICFYMIVQHLWLDNKNLDAHEHAKTDFAYHFCKMLMYGNNTFNFYIYCATGRRFRWEVTDLFNKFLTRNGAIEKVIKTTETSCAARE